jgi:hypothetical protein
MLTSDDEMVWHNDGHVINLRINRSELVISYVHCPGTEERACKVGKHECVVSHFLNTYGLECNVGTCECSSEIELAWCGLGDFDDLEQSQVWVIPTNDEAFAAWLITQAE